jgi:amino acid adenylation domain-containing protein
MFDTPEALLTHLRQLGVRLWVVEQNLRYEAPTGVVTPAIIGALRAHKAQLLGLVGREELRAQPRNGALRASFAQERLWFITQLDPDAPTYNVTLALRLRGQVDAGALERSLCELVRRHEVLRTSFRDEDGELHQVVHPEVLVPLAMREAQGATREAREESARTYLHDEVHRPFALTTGPLLRATLVRIDADEQVLVLAMHHIVTDGWSIGILQRELAALYDAFAAGKPSPLAALPIQYADYAAWQRTWLTGAVLDEQIAYWRKALADAPASLELPTDRPRPAHKKHRGANVRFELSADVVDGVRELARREGATLFMVLLAAYSALLGRWSGQNDVVVGTPIAGRTRMEVEPLIGMFVNTLAMRADLSGAPSFRELLARVKAAALGAYAHQDVPFERLVEVLAPRRDTSRTPIVQTMFALEGAPEALALGGVEVRSEPLELDVAKFDVMVALGENAGGLSGSVEYDVDLFDRATMERFAQHFDALLKGVVAAPDASVARVPLMSEAERRHVLTLAQGAQYGDVARETTSARFEAQAARTPHAEALRSGGRTMTYRELDARANQLARLLRKRGVCAGTRVVTFFARSLDMVVALLATLKAGAAYVPADPAYPPARITHMIADSGARVVLTTRALAHAAELSSNALALDDADTLAAIAREPDAPLPEEVSVLDEAYVIFTSGTTGKPKGVVIAHEHLDALVRWHVRAFGVTAGDRAAQLAGPAFDAAVWEIWPYLLTGASVAIPDEETRLDPEKLRNWFVADGTTIAFVPTALAEPLIGLEWPADARLRVLLTGGDRLTKRVSPSARFTLVNNYGPTECTVVSTSSPVAPEGSAVGAPPIGRPIDGARNYVLDTHLEPLPIGIPGELYIGGASVGRGYAGQPELTASRFVPDPFADAAGRTMYRTGDLVRWRADGELEFFGRLDHQVKIRGFRIELGEIESVLGACDRVREAAVMAVGARAEEKLLVAYVVSDDGVPLDPAALKARLATQLPDYMVPTAFVFLDAMPLTPNGKLDRRALPAPDLATSAAEYVAPRTPTELAIARIWQELLRLERVGVHDDFFALGGHSLLAMRAATRLQALHSGIGVRQIFAAPTVEALARWVDDSSSARATSPEGALVRVARGDRIPLSRLQERVWFAESLQPGSTAYLMPFANRLRGKLDAKALKQAFATIVERHEALRTTFDADADGAFQVVHGAPFLDFEQRDLTHLAQAAREPTVLAHLQQEATTTFDLRRGPLLRVKLFVLDELEHVLSMTMHHIVSDGWSVGVIARELSELYAAFCAGEPSPLEDLTIQFRDYTAWDRGRVTDAELAKQLAYWKAHLEGAPALELATDRPRPATQRHRGAFVSGVVSPAVTGRLNALGRRHGTTMYMTLLTAFTALLGRLSGQSDIVVATPVAYRNRPELEALVGFFINTLAVRVDVSGNPTFEELLVRAREASLDAYSNQDVPFERVVQEVNPVRDASRNPIAQVALNVLNLPDTGIRLAGLTAEGIASGGDGSKFDLNLYVAEEDGLTLELSYDADLFDEARVRRILRRFSALVEELASRPSARVSEISLVAGDDRAVLPNPAAPLATSSSPSIANAFELHVQNAPERLAVSDERRRFSYGDLGGRANQLAHWLREHGVTRGDLVAVHAERNALTVWAMLGIMKSGGAFVLLDADYPVTRLVEQLRATKASVLIDATDRDALPPELAAALPAGARTIDLAHAGEPWASYPATKPEVTIDEGARAYVLFTSGTTGGPKGLECSHGPLGHFVEWYAQTYALRSDDRFSALSGIGHDPFLRDVLAPLAIGASVCVPPAHLRLEPDALVEWLSKEQVTVCHLTPSLGTVIGMARSPSLPALRLACFGGEKLTGELVGALRPIAPGATFVNFYGATETPQAMGYFTVPSGATGVVPIGRGIDGVQLLVLTSSGVLAGVDEEGEICIRTRHLAMGYLDGAARGFGRSPFSDDPEDRMYRTGDRGRYLPDGTIEALGRLDDQVKIRGFRVELGEVQSALTELGHVRDAVVIVRATPSGENQLVGYVVSDQSALDVADVRAFLKTKLPDYMIPAAIVVLGALPLTPNGKLDRKALPLPDVVASTNEYVAPSGAVEEGLAAIWCDVLGVPRVSVVDDFFVLGGHSLLAIRMVARVERDFGVELSVGAIFEMPTVRALAASIELALADDDLSQMDPPA